jgi:hypothetical protein
MHPPLIDQDPSPKIHTQSKAVPHDAKYIWIGIDYPFEKIANERLGAIDDLFHRLLFVEIDSNIDVS